jgi:hypothetical protein
MKVLSSPDITSDKLMVHFMILVQRRENVEKPMDEKEEKII